jgi:predicted flap endonuclease-1-like 5' DNA nuclease
MSTYANWLSEAGALWYRRQSLLLLVLAYVHDCVFGCWFRRIQPQRAEVLATMPRTVRAEPVPEPRPAPVGTRVAQPAPAGRLRNAFEDQGVPEPRPVVRSPESALTMDVIRGALATGQPAVKPPAVPVGPVVSTPDDLKRIKGIGPEIERKLNALDVVRYQDIVSWRAADVDRVGKAIGAEGRLTHENWIEQAAILAAGGETTFSRRVDRKEVLANPKDTWMPVAPTQVEQQGMVTAEAKPRDPTSDPRRAASAVAAAAEEIGHRLDAPVVHGATAAVAEAVAAGRIALKPAVPAAPVVKPVAAVQAAASAQPKPRVAMPSAAKPEPDDLKRIRGITPEIEKQLNALGVNRFAQIAGWSQQAVEKASSVLSAGNRITQENWVEQAMILARGGETEYSRRLKLGAVPVAPPPATPTPVGGGHTDDLKRVRGIGIVIEAKLNTMGIRTYADIARWTPGDAERFAEALDIPGRIERENWIGQAQVLASGQSTEFSNRVDRGDVVPSKD